MSAELQARAKAFLERPIPKTLNYVPDSLSERFVLTYANLGTIHLDEEYSELLDICALEAFRSSETKDVDVSDFFQESALVLQAIQSELRPKSKQSQT